MGQFKGAQEAYRERISRVGQPRTQLTYAYGSLSHYGQPASKADRAAQNRQALLRLSHEEHQQFNKAKRETETTCPNWVSSPENWDIVRQILDKKPLLSLERAKEMAMMGQ